MVICVQVDDVDTYRVNHVDCNCNVFLQNKYVQLENGKVPNLSNKGMKGHRMIAKGN